MLVMTLSNDSDNNVWYLLYQQIWDLRIRMFDLFEGSLHIVGRIIFDLGPKI